MRLRLLTLLLASCTRTPEPPRPPSILLVTLDTTRADRLGPYGYEEANTPTWDRLAASGTVFERAYTSAPITIPSHSTILTGRFPPSHGVRDNGAFILGDEQVLISERLSEAGYRTSAFTSAFPTHRRWGFNQGFDLYSDPMGGQPDRLDWRNERPADAVVDDALEALAEPDDRPDFVWLHFFDAHWPYAPPEPFASQHDEPYDGEIAFVDHQVERFLAWWNARHPESIIVITADHGEGFGDGGEETHGFLLHDGTMRVPLIVSGTDIPAGQRVDDVVGTVDIVPTLLDAVGLPHHEGIQGANLFEGGSNTIYGEATTGQYSLGLATLYSLTGEEGRYMEGAWGGWYPAHGHHIPFEHEESVPTNAHSEELGMVRAKLDQVVAPTASLDADSLEQLMALGYVGGDTMAESGDIDPRDVIDVIPLTWRVRQAMGSAALGEAGRLLEVLGERMPETFGVRLLEAQLLRRKGQLEQATAILTDLFLDAPSGTLALQIADLQEAQGRVHEAHLWFEEALELVPNSAEAMTGIVRTLWTLGEPERAAELADTYLLVYPDHGQLLCVRALFVADAGDLERALEDIELALELLDTPSPWALTIAASVEWELGRPDRAIDYLTQVLRMTPYHVPRRLQLTAYLLDVKRNAEALRTIRPLFRTLPEEPAVADLFRRAEEGVAAELAR